MPSDGPQDHEAASKRPLAKPRPGNGGKAKPRGNGRAEGFAALLQSALDEPDADEGGRRRRASKREMVIRRLVEKSAGADLAATKLLFELLRKADIEEAAGAPADTEPFSQGALEELKARLARLAAAAAAAADPPADPVPRDPPERSDAAAGAAIEAEGHGAP